MNQTVSIVCLVIGMAVSLAALYLKSRESKDRQRGWRERITGTLDYEAALRKMEEYMTEMDKGLDEFHSTANSAVKELDEKYQELLFLYSMIDEKKKEIVYTNPQPVAQAEKPAKPPAGQSRAADKPKTNHPRRKEILNLSKQGLDVAEIAEELNIGQDMVRLILELGKAR